MAARHDLSRPVPFELVRGMERLLELQSIDSTIDRSTQRAAQLSAGEELRSARAAMEDAESRLGEVRLGIDALAREQGRLEHEVDSMTQKAGAEEKRLYDGSVANAKELEALQHEIANLKERRSRTEDTMIEQMERREDLDARAAEADAEVATTRARVEAIGGEAVRELAQIEADLVAKREEREALVPEIDEELLELYEDLRAQKKGIAVAALVDGICQACHEQLSAMELDKLKHTDGVRRCEYCRRILIFA
jgi:predicted  nucleic acid-binding Zn-ribbon protein